MEYINSLVKEKKAGSLPVAVSYLDFFVSMIVIIST